MLPKEKKMEALEAFDLTKSFRAAGLLIGVDHHTVARAVAARALGQSMEEPPGLGGDGSLRRQDHRVDRPFRRQDPSRCRPREAQDNGLHRFRTHHPAGGGGVEEGLPPPDPPDLQAVDHRAGNVAAVRLRDGPGHQRCPGRAVLRLVGVEPVPGDHPPRRPGTAVGDRRARHHLPPHRRGAHLRLDRQREDRHRLPPVRHRGAQRARPSPSRVTTG